MCLDSLAKINSSVQLISVQKTHFESTVSGGPLTSPAVLVGGYWNISKGLYTECMFSFVSSHPESLELELNSTNTIAMKIILFRFLALARVGSRMRNE